MRSIRTRANAIAAALLLASGGAGIGMLMSSATSSDLVWQRPAAGSAVKVSGESTIDQFAAGRAWARSAFDGGLGECPPMNADFVAGCAAELKALKARPAFAAGSYGGPLLVTTYTPPTEAVERPEPIVDPPVPEPEPIQPAFEPTPANYPAAAPEDHPPL